MSEPLPLGLTGLTTDPDEAQRRIEQWAAGFAAKAERYEAVQARVEQLRSSATSPDGAVRVTVRSDGSVTDVQFTERIRTFPLSELSATILATMRSAQAKVVEQVGETMSDGLGDEDAQTRAATMDQLRARFPEPEEDGDEETVADKWDYDQQESAPPETPPPPPAPPRPTGPSQRPGPDDDGFDSDFDPLRD